MIGKILLFILEHCPHLEIAVRCFLWRFPQIKKFISDSNRKTKNVRQEAVNPEIWEKVKQQLKDFDIKRGDTVLVHSSMDGLAKTRVSAKEAIDYLLELIGEEGTLVFAAYPKCKAYKADKDVLYYDPQKTISWTGLLPNVFCKYKGVIRSEFPYNSLAAKGPLAEDIIKDNLKGDTSQGEYSSWKYLAVHHAKILYLGVSAAMSCTMMNYPEDALGDEWYVDNWYYEQKYAIKIGDDIVYKTIKERYPEWYRFYAMFYSETWMRKNGFLKRKVIDGVYVGITEDMTPFAEKLLELGLKNKSVYIIPKKYWKRR